MFDPEISTNIRPIPIVGSSHPNDDLICVIYFLQVAFMK